MTLLSFLLWIVGPVSVGSFLVYTAVLEWRMWRRDQRITKLERRVRRLRRELRGREEVERPVRRVI